MIRSPWRTDFPGLLALDAEGQTYLDSAATTQKPQAVLDALLGYYAGGAANVHRAQHLPGERATQAFENSRTTAARWLNATSHEEIVFTRGVTESLNLLAYGLEHLFKPGEQIVISAAEHHANLLPWQQLARRKNLQLQILPLNELGDIDLAQASRLIGPRCRLLAITQLSNVLGRWQPLAELLELAANSSAFTVIDGAQGAVHSRPDVQALGCDFYVCSSHKIYGPDGVGLLYGRHAALEQLQPWQFGGEMLHQATYHSARFRPAPLGLEAGTPAVSGVIALGAALDYLGRLDSEAIQQHEKALHQLLLSGLQQRPGIRLLGAPQVALACFNLAQVHCSDLAHLLSEQGIAVRAGHHCTMPLLQSLDVDGAIRVSLGLYNDESDLQSFFSALDKSLELLL